MLIREGDARHDALNRRLAALLAAIAGALNAAAFYAVGFFSANMTGNVSALSDRIAQGESRSAGFYLSIVAAFIAGAAVSATMIDAGRRRNTPRVYGYVLLVEAVLLAALGGTALSVTTLTRGPLLVIGLAFLMGLQNAVVTRISSARVRTTHISGMATDLGIELANLVDGKMHGRALDDSVANRNNLWLHLTTILAFLAGGVLGVAIYREIGLYLLFVAAAALALVAWAGTSQAPATR